jgi:hypothetical protein
VDDNPFERYDLDPREGIAAITQRLKELAEDAKDDAERERIRAAWEELTLHPQRRLRAALLAHPETRRPLGSPPPLPRVTVRAAELGLRDLAARPSVSSSLPAKAGAPTADEDAAPGLDDDPILTGAAR